MDTQGAVLFTLPGGAGVLSAENGLFIVRDGAWAERGVTLRRSDGTALSESCSSIYRLDSDRLAYSLTDENGHTSYGLMANDGSFVTDAQYDSLACVTDGMYCTDMPTGAILIDAEGDIINTFKASRSD